LKRNQSQFSHKNVLTISAALLLLLFKIWIGLLVLSLLIWAALEINETRHRDMFICPCPRLKTGRAGTEGLRMTFRVSKQEVAYDKHADSSVMTAQAEINFFLCS
jgi:hypothetical protein